MNPIATLVLRASLLALGLFASSGSAQAAGPILIWPVDPVIEHDEAAAALWLENRGTQSTLLQLRIFDWSQVGGESAYRNQNDIVGTPPMIRIEPGARQLVRLTRTTRTPPGKERAYRVIVDEIPIAASQGSQAKETVGVRFQMRYSIPLFAYGEGLSPRPAEGRKRGAALVGAPKLDWEIAGRDGDRYLEIRNRGTVHARLTNAEFFQGATASPVAPGLLGYVLPGATARWLLPDGVEAGGVFRATVNGAEMEINPGTR